MRALKITVDNCNHTLCKSCPLLQKTVYLVDPEVQPGLQDPRDPVHHRHQVDRSHPCDPHLPLVRAHPVGPQHPDHQGDQARLWDPLDRRFPDYREFRGRLCRPSDLKVLLVPTRSGTLILLDMLFSIASALQLPRSKVNFQEPCLSQRH